MQPMSALTCLTFMAVAVLFTTGGFVFGIRSVYRAKRPHWPAAKGCAATARSMRRRPRADLSLAFEREPR